VLLLPLRGICATRVEPAAPSCEGWQASAEKSGHSTGQITARVVGSAPVAVFTAPAATCKCPGSELAPAMKVTIDRRFNGFVRVLYINAAAGTQISGWVISAHLRQVVSKSSAV